MYLLIAGTILGLLTVGAFAGAPWLPTQKPQSRAALELLDLEAGQTVLDLGSGGGTFLLMAARQGIKGIGYEISPIIWFISKIRTWRYRKLVKIHLGDYWRTRLPECDAVYVFLLNRYMTKLDRKLQYELTKPTPVASLAFKIPGRDHVEERSGVLLYRYEP